MTDARSLGALTAIPQPFEEALLQTPVWRVLVDGTPDAHDIAALAVATRVEQVGLAMCRLDEGDPAIELFSAAGFRPVEVLLTYDAPLPAAAVMPAGVRTAVESDIADCRAVAAASFRFDRFHTDTVIDHATADSLKAQWVENALRGRADAVLVAEREGTIAGFNACLLTPGAAVIDLIAVRPHAQGAGIGRMLVSGAFAHFAGRAPVLRVGTQEDNHASCRLYESFGMEVVRRQVTLHWTPGSAPTTDQSRKAIDS